MRGCFRNGRGTKEGSVQSQVVFIPGSLKTTRNLRSKQLIWFLHDEKGTMGISAITSFQPNILSLSGEGRSAFRNMQSTDSHQTSEAEALRSTLNTRGHCGAW